MSFAKCLVLIGGAQNQPCLLQRVLCCNRLLIASHSVALHCSASAQQHEKLHWNEAVSAAEKVVGYPTSFMNLRFWLSDEMSNVAVNLRKLIGTKHPLMKTAKGLLFDNKENMQTRGLVVLLMSKAAGHPEARREFPHHSLDKVYSPGQLTETRASSEGNGILASQRSLAEITEMMNTAFVLHRGVMNIDLSDKSKPYDSDTEDLLYGNKLTLLSGDYLLAKASAGLAGLGNTYVVEVMASAICDLMESQFFIDDLKMRIPKFDLELWEQLSYRKGACLYAKSCQSALMLSEHTQATTDMAFKFGKYFGFLRQMKADIAEANTPDMSTESLCNILRPGEMEAVKQTYLTQAKDSLAGLANIEARTALLNILNALSENMAVQ